ncbi:MAG: UDP-N-acetylglucosamine 2-epimerase (non-hydrolyzing) [Micrococcaceae bacterium]
MKRLCLIYGTRPEAVKFASLIEEVKQDPDIDAVIINTGQHKSMVKQVHDFFEITPDVELDIFKPGQPIANILASAVEKLQDYFNKSEKFDAVVVQGDTTTTIAAGIAAFYNNIPVVHLEAGMRSGNLWSPFPEEANRKMLTHITSLHLAPSHEGVNNLLKEGISDKDIILTGSTAIDAARIVSESSKKEIPYVKEIEGKKLLLVTTHRRENLGENLESIVAAIKETAKTHDDIVFVVPMHKNPEVRKPYYKYLENLDNVILSEPLDYISFTTIMQEAFIVLTDSGGVQEEAPYFHIPVLLLRDDTERPEAVTAGAIKLIGSDTQKIVDNINLLLTDPKEYNQMAHAVYNEESDGYAAKKSLKAIKEMLK